MIEVPQVSARTIGNRDLDRLRAAVIVHELGHAFGTLCALERDIELYDSMNPRIVRNREAGTHRFVSDFYSRERTPDQEFMGTIGGAMAGCGFMSVAFTAKASPDWGTLSPTELLAHGVKDSMTSPGDIVSLLNLALELTPARQAWVVQMFLWGRHAARDELTEMIVDLKRQVDDRPEGFPALSGLLALIGEPDYKAAATDLYSAHIRAQKELLARLEERAGEAEAA